MFWWVSRIPTELHWVDKFVEVHLQGLVRVPSKVSLAHVGISLVFISSSTIRRCWVGVSIIKLAMESSTFSCMKDTHADLGLVLVHGDGLLPAGGVTPGAPVEFVLGAYPVGHAQNGADLFLGGWGSLGNGPRTA